MEIKVLGSGCAKCKNLETKVVELVVKENIKANIEKVTDLKEIMSYGIMSTPGLVINGKVVASGKIPSESDILKWIKEAE